MGGGSLLLFLLFFFSSPLSISPFPLLFLHLLYEMSKKQDNSLES